MNFLFEKIKFKLFNFESFRGILEILADQSSRIFFDDSILRRLVNAKKNNKVSSEIFTKIK